MLKYKLRLIIVAALLLTLASCFSCSSAPKGSTGHKFHKHTIVCTHFWFNQVFIIDHRGYYRGQPEYLVRWNNGVISNVKESYLKECKHEQF